MADLVTEYDGWSYYDNGTAVSPSGEYYFAGEKVWSPSPEPPATAAQGSEWVNNLGSMFGYAGKTYMDTWSAKTMMQTSQNGQRYIEGQRFKAAQGTMSPLLLLLLAGAAFVAMK